MATVYRDEATGAPEWLTVKTGLFGMKETFVPLALARVRGERQGGAGCRQGHRYLGAEDQPKGQLSQAEEEQLFSYYGLGYGEWRSPTGLPETSGQSMTDAYGAPGAQGNDTSGPTTDEAMTRSEEQLRVGTETGRRAGPGCASTS